MKRLAIIITHPIQYYVPVFQLLNQQKDIELMVFYTWGEKAIDKFDPGFGKKIEWDIPLLNGYPHQWVTNTSHDPGSHNFKGIINPDLISRVKLWNADAILIYGWAYHSHLKALRYFKGKVPVYFRGDSTLLDESTGIKNWMKWIFLRWVYSNVDHAFYTGQQNKAYFKKYGLKENQLTFAPHAVDNVRFSSFNKERSMAIREGFGMGPADILVLFAGKLEQKKSPDMLLQAFNSLQKANVHLLFVGNGPMGEMLKTLAGEVKTSNVHWLDFQNQSVMPDIYHACDLFCLPSKGPGESWGLAVNEAMAAGKPALVSDKVGCAVDLVIPGVTGEIFQAGNTDDLVEKLQLLIEDKDRLSRYGRNAKEKIAAWSFERQVSAILKQLSWQNAG